MIQSQSRGSTGAAGNVILTITFLIGQNVLANTSSGPTVRSVNDYDLVWITSLGDHNQVAVAAVVRDKNSVRLGVTHTIPIADGWSTYQQVEHLWGDSNIPNFTFQDTAVILGLTRTF